MSVSCNGAVFEVGRFPDFPWRFLVYADSVVIQTSEVVVLEQVGLEARFFWDRIPTRGVPLSLSLSPLPLRLRLRRCRLSLLYTRAPPSPSAVCCFFIFLQKTEEKREKKERILSIERRRRKSEKIRETRGAIAAEESFSERRYVREKERRRERERERDYFR